MLTTNLIYNWRILLKKREIEILSVYGIGTLALPLKKNNGNMVVVKCIADCKFYMKIGKSVGN